MKETIACCSRKVIPSLCSALLRYIWSVGPGFCTRCKSNIDILEVAQWRAMQTAVALEQMVHKETLRKIDLLSLEKKDLGEIS